ncbi:coiled-coil domain-containing protein 191 isoform X2 [Narcine bancroftii]|uniref:coiled-coil domain-containing protein 191 isoform X2 n=1 Tax=Narcine bancroftii TaxID=1343680 RepID=UPI0038316D20
MLMASYSAQNDFWQDPADYAKQNMDYDDIQGWIKRVEQASECAVAEVFPSKKLKIHPKVSGHVMTMETVDQLCDHDDAYAEAQELLNEWMNSKLRKELAYEEAGELENYMKGSEAPIYSTDVFSRIPEYENFDDLYNYLEQEKESDAAQFFIQQLLEKKMEESGILDDLGIDEERPQKKTHISMEARHQHVKENRLKRQAQLEKQKQEKAMKKLAHAEAHQLLQEENRKKALQNKKEEEHIQKEMVHLRKEMMEKRHLMEEAKRLEQEHQKKEEKQKLLAQEKVRQALIELLQQKNQDRHEVENLQIMQEVDARIKSNQLRCLQKHFSTWYKLVLERRLKMGKASALSDWKSQLRIFRAWRRYIWGKKLEQEVQCTEMDLQVETRKKQLASECNRKHKLRYCFTNWQLWCKAEKEKRELEAQKKKTKQKMAALLDSASSGKLTAVSCRASRWLHGMQQVVPAQNMMSMKKQDPSPVNAFLMTEDRKTHPFVATRPKFAWQITHKHAELHSEAITSLPNTGTITDGGQKHHKSHSSNARKVIQHFQGNFTHNHAFQQQLIEDQKKQLQEKQKIIEELQEKQQLTMLQQEAKLASAITTAIVNATQKMQVEINRQGRRPAENVQLDMKDIAVHTLRSIGPASAEESSHSTSITICSKTNHNMISPHPIVKAMEERAKHRMARRKELEEIKRKKEEEKLVHLRAEDEKRQIQQEAEKQALLEKKREEKRLQRQKETEKQLRLEKQRQNQCAAKKHYEEFLLNKRGLGPWRKLLEISKQNMKFSEDHYNSSLLRNCVCIWHQNVSESLAEKKFKAEKVYNGILLKKCLKNWHKYKEYINILEERANQHHLTILRRSIFIAWGDFVIMEKTASWKKERIGTEHHQKRLVKSVFMAWKTFPILNREEKRKEECIQELRKKVAEILPDFLIQ